MVMKKIALVIACFSLLIIFLSCASTSRRSFAESASLPVRLAPDVNSDMLTADYWIKRSKNPFKVRMSLSEIAAWNRENSNLLYPGSVSLPLLTDLRKIDSHISAAEIRDGMFRHSSKNPWLKKVKTKNGEEVHEVTQKEWRLIFEAMNYSSLESYSYFSGGKVSDSASYKKDFPVRKAICVRRTNMRLIPDDGFYTDDEKNWYDDVAQNSGMLLGEPLLVLWESKEKNWLYVRTSYCTGWVHAEDVAFCSGEEFNRYFDYAEKPQDTFVTITDDRFILPDEYVLPCESDDFSGVSEFFMGTYLFTADWNDKRFESALHPRLPYASYMVEIPYRNSAGNLSLAYATIPAGRCSLGLLDYTSANVLTLAFKPLGIRYGWGGMENARDCSEYLKDIYRCFGFSLPRNSRAQLSVAGKSVNFDGKSLSSRKSALSSLEAGTLMGFPGHVFMYLGKVDGKNYVISALGFYYFDSENPETEDALAEIPANSVNINTLSVIRKNGKSWLEMLTQVKKFKDDGSWIDDRIYFDLKWQFAEFSKINSGKAFFYKAKKKRKNITVAVNAGHGTKGGALVKTFSHPDKSPKVTGGTTLAGALESIAISDGMVFKNGRRESEVNLRTAHLLCGMLLDAGYDVLMIRDYEDVQLDNVARTVMANNNAKIHISIHYDSDNTSEDKGVFYCSVPEGIKYLPNVKKHWKESERLGECLVQGLASQDLKVFGGGKMDIDLTQTSYSTIPSVDIELGNQHTDTNTEELKKRARGLLEGVELFFQK